MLSLISQVVDHFSLNKFKNEQKECLLKKYDINYYRDLPSYLQKLIDTLEINHECIYDILDFIDEYKKDQKNKNPIHWEDAYNIAKSSTLLNHQ